MASILPTAPFLRSSLLAALRFTVSLLLKALQVALLTLRSRLLPLFLRRPTLERRCLNLCRELMIFLPMLASHFRPLLPSQLVRCRRPLVCLLQVLTYHLVSRLIMVAFALKSVLLFGPGIPVTSVLALVGR